jgi:hypothetical protein
MVLFAVHRKYEVSASQLIPVDHRRITLVVACITSAGVLWLTWVESRGLSTLFNTALLVLLFVAAYVVTGWRHPYRSQLARAWQSRTAKAVS